MPSPRPKLTNLLATLSLMVLPVCDGCQHQQYQLKTPYQSFRIERDVIVQASFPANMPDGSIQRVKTSLVVRAGSIAKFPTADEANRYEQNVQHDLRVASTQPTK